MRNLNLGGKKTTMLDSLTIDNALQILNKEKVFTIQKIISLLGCSRRTAQTKLSMWKVYTSYNQNSKYYCLPEIPKFDSKGIWWYKNIAFSKYGNLKETIVYLVNSSEIGLTGKELGALLGIPAQNFVHHFKNCPGICREKHGGVYIHLAGQADRYKLQIQRRQMDHEPVIKSTLSDIDAILILVAIIRNQDLTAEDIFALPEIRKSKMKLTDIQGFIKHHSLVKKIPDSML